MKLVGLIAEYNPFHNGHKYHIEKALELTGADAAVVVMSGNFVQRGAPAIMPKHLRTEAALKGGASLIIELPLCCATGSAEYFAHGAVSLLEKLGCVDSICFGSECGDITALQKLAACIEKEPEEYKTALNYYVRQGNSFPLARQKAIQDVLGSDIAASILDEPNNILGMEYLKALYRLESKIKPYTIKRLSSHYHDDSLQTDYSSAFAIRKAIEKRNSFDLIEQVPESCVSLYQKNYNLRYPVCADDFSILLKYKLLQETKESLTEYLDVSKDLANRILNRLNQFVSFEQFCLLLKTKETTYSRISRALIHILLDIKTTDISDIAYARVLGFKTDDSEVLSQIKKGTSIPLITKLTAGNNLPADAKAMLEKDILSSNLYESVIADKFHTDFINEFEQQIVRVKT